jgi:hypothetical protein
VHRRESGDTELGGRIGHEAAELRFAGGLCGFGRHRICGAVLRAPPWHQASFDFEAYWGVRCGER